LGVERLFPFKTYQDRQGAWTSSYVDWLYKDEAKFCLEVAIYPGDEDEKQGFLSIPSCKKTIHRPCQLF